MAHQQSELANRINRMLRRLPHFSVQALLILDMSNIRYLSGFTGSDGALFIGQGRRVLLVDGRYITQAKEETSGIEVLEYQEKIEGITNVLSHHPSLTVGFEATTVTVDTYTRLKNRLEKITLKPLPEEIKAIRAVKTAVEIAKIETAAAIASRALVSVLARIRAGMTEREIAADLDSTMIQCGAEAVAFPTIVASGKSSAWPHARPGLRKIQAGDVMMIDYGAVFEGYHSDETCTFVIGRADSKQKDVYQVVKEAHDGALKAIRAGISCHEIDRIARSCIEEHGFGESFSHGTGHGVGLDVHEFPRIAATSKNILEAGMVVTVEPGVYIPDLWGIRIEDLVLVKEGGSAVLSKIPKKFKVLEINTG